MATSVIKNIISETSAIELQKNNTVFMPGFRMPGGGFGTVIPITNIPKTVTGNGLAYFSSDSWISMTISGWYVTGNSLVLSFSASPLPSGTGSYPLKGTINLTY